jgi:hypothetical protein
LLALPPPLGEEVVGRGLVTMARRVGKGGNIGEVTGREMRKGLRGWRVSGKGDGGADLVS